MVWEYVYPTTIVLNPEFFYFAYLKSFTYRHQCCQNNSSSDGSAKTNQALYFACQAYRWQCHFVKKHYFCACMHTIWTHNTNAQDVIIFTNSRFCHLHRDDKSIVFKNMHFGTRCVNERPKFIKSCPFISCQWCYVNTHKCILHSTRSLFMIV